MSHRPLKSRAGRAPAHPSAPLESTFFALDLVFSEAWVSERLATDAAKAVFVVEFDALLDVVLTAHARELLEGDARAREAPGFHISERAVESYKLRLAREKGVDATEFEQVAVQILGHLLHCAHQVHVVLGGDRLDDFPSALDPDSLASVLEGAQRRATWVGRREDLGSTLAETHGYLGQVGVGALREERGVRVDVPGLRSVLLRRLQASQPSLHGALVLELSVGDRAAQIARLAARFGAADHRVVVLAHDADLPLLLPIDAVVRPNSVRTTSEVITGRLFSPATFLRSQGLAPDVFLPFLPLLAVLHPSAFLSASDLLPLHSAIYRRLTSTSRQTLAEDARAADTAPPTTRSPDERGNLARWLAHLAGDLDLDPATAQGALTLLQVVLTDLDWIPGDDDGAQALAALRRGRDRLLQPLRVLADATAASAVGGSAVSGGALRAAPDARSSDARSSDARSSDARSSAEAAALRARLAVVEGLGAALAHFLLSVPDELDSALADCALPHWEAGGVSSLEAESLVTLFGPTLGTRVLTYVVRHAQATREKALAALPATAPAVEKEEAAREAVRDAFELHNSARLEAILWSMFGVFRLSDTNRALGLAAFRHALTRLRASLRADGRAPEGGGEALGGAGGGRSSTASGGAAATAAASTPTTPLLVRGHESWCTFKGVNPDGFAARHLRPAHLALLVPGMEGFVLPRVLFAETARAAGPEKTRAPVDGSSGVSTTVEAPGGLEDATPVEELCQLVRVPPALPMPATAAVAVSEFVVEEDEDAEDASDDGGAGEMHRDGRRSRRPLARIATVSLPRSVALPDAARCWADSALPREVIPPSTSGSAAPAKVVPNRAVLPRWSNLVFRADARKRLDLLFALLGLKKTDADDLVAWCAPNPAAGTKLQGWTLPLLALLAWQSKGPLREGAVTCVVATMVTQAVRSAAGGEGRVSPAGHPSPVSIRPPLPHERLAASLAFEFRTVLEETIALNDLLGRPVEKVPRWSEFFSEATLRTYLTLAIGEFVPADRRVARPQRPADAVLGEMGQLLRGAFLGPDARFRIRITDPKLNPAPAPRPSRFEHPDAATSGGAAGGGAAARALAATRKRDPKNPWGTAAPRAEMDAKADGGEAGADPSGKGDGGKVDASLPVLSRPGAPTPISATPISVTPVSAAPAAGSAGGGGSAGVAGAEVREWWVVEWVPRALVLRPSRPTSAPWNLATATRAVAQALEPPKPVTPAPRGRREKTTKEPSEPPAAFPRRPADFDARLLAAHAARSPLGAVLAPPARRFLTRGLERVATAIIAQWTSKDGFGPLLSRADASLDPAAIASALAPDAPERVARSPSANATVAELRRLLPLVASGTVDPVTAATEVHETLAATLPRLLLQVMVNYLATSRDSERILRLAAFVVAFLRPSRVSLRAYKPLQFREWVALRRGELHAAVGAAPPAAPGLAPPAIVPADAETTSERVAPGSRLPAGLVTLGRHVPVSEDELLAAIERELRAYVLVERRAGERSARGVSPQPPAGPGSRGVPGPRAVSLAESPQEDLRSVHEPSSLAGPGVSLTIDPAADAEAIRIGWLVHELSVLPAALESDDAAVPAAYAWLRRGLFVDATRFPCVALVLAAARSHSDPLDFATSGRGSAGGAVGAGGGASGGGAGTPAAGVTVMEATGEVTISPAGHRIIRRTGKKDLSYLRRASVLSNVSTATDASDLSRATVVRRDAF